MGLNLERFGLPLSLFPIFRSMLVGGASGFVGAVVRQERRDPRAASLPAPLLLVEGRRSANPSVAWFEATIQFIVLALEAAAAVGIVLAATYATGLAVRKRSLTTARHAFVNGLLFALDFTIGADILKVALAPDLRTVGTVGGVVFVRVALTVALVWEAKHEHREAPAAA
jgi:uncharacterized membrane protein